MAKKPKPAPITDEAAPEKEQITKRVFGRPTKYRPEMLDVMRALAEDGASKAELAVALGINRDTFDEWRRNNPDFSEAVKECELLAQVWWEQQGKNGMTGKNPNFNATAFIFQVKNRFRNDYMDTQRTEVTGKDGGPVQLEAKVVEVDDFDEDQLAVLEAALLAAKDKAG